MCVDKYYKEFKRYKALERKGDNNNKKNRFKNMSITTVYGKLRITHFGQSISPLNHRFQYATAQKHDRLCIKSIKKMIPWYN
jgi:hypothetical protein